MGDYTVKRIVCLANSRMRSGRCIAGKELEPDGRSGRWIRPVSGWSIGGLSEKERRYEDGTEPRVLDVIDLAVGEPKPEKHQRENWPIDAKHCWVKAGRMDWKALAERVDADSTLWVNGNSSDNSVNDRVPVSDTDSLESSLSLIRVEELRVNVSASDGESVPVLRGSFTTMGSSIRFESPTPTSRAVRLAWLKETIPPSAGGS